MNPKEPLHFCHFCNKLAIDTRRVVVDIDAGHEGDEWNANSIYSEVELCQEHLDAYDSIAEN